VKAEPVPGDREIVVTRRFAAPRALVFAAWTDREHIGRWWGPQGFTTTTTAMDVRPGGMWLYTMHGPDGTDYPNWIRYREVVAPALLAYDHGGGASDAPAEFQVTATFTEVGGQTEVVLRMTFPTAQARAAVVERYGALQGGEECLARLGSHLGATPGSASAKAGPVLRLMRTFAAPRDLVFRAWTDPTHLAAWWGPDGFTSPRCEFDARPGGALHIDMRDPEGGVHPLPGVVREVRAPEWLVFTCRTLDERGRPVDVRNEVTLTAAGESTSVHVVTTVALVDGAGEPDVGGMTEGWRQSLARLGAHVAAQAGAGEGDLARREVVATRVIAAPRTLVYRAWIEAERLARWWGPRGFTNRFSVFEPRPGGAWRYVMRGPDGREFPNESVFVELEPDERVVLDHLASMHRFRIVASFSDEAGGTRVVFRQAFTSAEQCDAVRGFVVPANEENLDRLQAEVALMA